MAWRKWLAEKGDSGPHYEGGECAESYRADSGRLDRRALLDRHTQHTVNCKACSQVRLLTTQARGKERQRTGQQDSLATSPLIVTR